MLRLLNICEEKCIGLVEQKTPALGSYLRRYQRLARYLISGGTAATVDLALLYLFTEGFGMHYLFSATLAFLVAFCISFMLQKFWTFQDHSTDQVRTQAVVYFFVAVANLLFNVLLMYVFVEKFRFWYIAAQILSGALIACESFFVSRYFIFKARHSNEP